ncbi:MAG TPA: hypothetical protein VGN14_07065 [Candidatus Elarobacter sp.]
MPPTVGVPVSTLALSPSPVELTSDAISQTFVVQNDNAGTAYTATAAPSCQSADGGTFVAGDGQALTAVAGVPTMFLVYAVGNAPATCTISIASSGGETGAVDATYQTIVVQSSRRRTPLATSPGVIPATVTFTKASQVAPVAVSNLGGTATVSAGACASGTSGISVNPKSLPSGGGTIVIAPFGIGAVTKACTVTVTDAGGNRVTIPVSIATTALGKFSASVDTVQFACAGTTPPLHCRTIGTVTLSEAGAAKFSIGARAFVRTNCDFAFQSPIKMVGTSGVPSATADGPSATVSFDGLLNGTALNCSTIAINDGGDPQQVIGIRVNPQLAAAPPPAITAAAAPACKGADPYVAVPNGPHGMYVWIPTTFVQKDLINYVIGKDPTLCGASMVVYWKDVEPKNGTYAFDTIHKTASNFTGLTINLLFADATEGAASVTPDWVLASHPSVTCNDPKTGAATSTPVYFDSGYEQDWENFIGRMEQQFSFSGDTGTTDLAPSVGYMRFATAGGAEALTPPYITDTTCRAKWEAAATTAGYATFYDAWNAHEAKLIAYMGSQPTDKQIVASLPSIPGVTNVYTVPNMAASVAVAHHVGLSFESLGQNDVAAFGSTPGACNPQLQLINLHWCQPYTRHAGQVPLAMQPITATTSTSVVTMDIAKLLPYALDNNIQIFELYGDEWLEADSPNPLPDAPAPAATASPADRARYKAALQAASLVLGATNGH